MHSCDRLKVVQSGCRVPKQQFRSGAHQNAKLLVVNFFSYFNYGGESLASMAIDS